MSAEKVGPALIAAGLLAGAAGGYYVGARENSATEAEAQAAQQYANQQEAGYIALASPGSCEQNVLVTFLKTKDNYAHPLREGGNADAILDAVCGSSTVAEHQVLAQQAGKQFDTVMVSRGDAKHMQDSVAYTLTDKVLAMGMGVSALYVGGLSIAAAAYGIGLAKDKREMRGKPASSPGITKL